MEVLAFIIISGLGSMENDVLYWSLLVFTLIPIIPAKWADPFSYSMSQKTNFPADSYSLFRLIIKSILKTFSDFAITLGLKGSASLLIFVVIVTDLYFSRKISNVTVILVSISVLALYLDQLIERGNEITIGKFFTWKKFENNN